MSSFIAPVAFVSQDISPQLDARIESKLDSRVIQELIMQPVARQDTRLDTRLDTKLDAKQVQLQQQVQVLKLDTKQELETRQRQELKSIAIQTPILRTKLFPQIILPPILSSEMFSSQVATKKPVGSKKGFIAQVKEKGKWKNVTKKPRTRREALALAGHIVDNSTAVQLRLIEAKKNAIKETTGRRIKINKYRDFSIRKGKKKPLPSHGLIELRKNRIDTSGEKNQLSAAKVLKSKGFKSLTRATRKKKSPSSGKKTGGLFK